MLLEWYHNKVVSVHSILVESVPKSRLQKRGILEEMKGKYILVPIVFVLLLHSIQCAHNTGQVSVAGVEYIVEA